MEKTGIELIAEERHEQLEKHGRSVSLDFAYNDRRQLVRAAIGLLEKTPDIDNVPDGWDHKIWAKMCHKDYHSRLKIAGALLAAEIDRIQYKP